MPTLRIGRRVRADVLQNIGDVVMLAERMWGSLIAVVPVNYNIDVRGMYFKGV